MQRAMAFQTLAALGELLLQLCALLADF